MGFRFVKGIFSDEKPNESTLEIKEATTDESKITPVAIEEFPQEQNTIEEEVIEETTEEKPKKKVAAKNKTK